MSIVKRERIFYEYNVMRGFSLQGFRYVSPHNCKNVMTVFLMITGRHAKTLSYSMIHAMVTIQYVK